jgi:uncharacterized membrane protein
MGRASRRKRNAVQQSGGASMEELRRKHSAQAQFVEQVVEQRLEASFYSGPIPDPDMLAQFEHVLPGSADRLLRMAEKEQDHRHEDQRRRTGAEVFQRKGGLMSATVICLLVAGGGIYLLGLGRNIEGFVALIGSLGVLAASFIAAFAAKASQKAPPPVKRPAGQLQLPLRR